MSAFNIILLTYSSSELPTENSPAFCCIRCEITKLANKGLHAELWGQRSSPDADSQSLAGSLIILFAGCSYLSLKVRFLSGDP